MEFVADVLLVAGALGAGTYCYVLARRLSRFNDLEKGVGGAVAILSAQVDDLTMALGSAQTASDSSAETIADLTSRAEAVAHRLELMIAALQDVPEAADKINAEPQPAAHRHRKGEPMFVRHHRSTETRQ